MHNHDHLPASWFYACRHTLHFILNAVWYVGRRATKTVRLLAYPLLVLVNGNMTENVKQQQTGGTATKGFASAWHSWRVGNNQQFNPYRRTFLFRIVLLCRGTRQLLMLGIEVLAHHEHEREGYSLLYSLTSRLEVYISEGRNVPQNTAALTRRRIAWCAKTFHVLRWIVWLAAILLNFADPVFVSFCLFHRS